MTTNLGEGKLWIQTRWNDLKMILCCTIGPTFSAVKKERSPQKKKKNSQTRRYVKKRYSSRLLFGYDRSNSKSSFQLRPSSPFLMVGTGCGWHTPVIADWVGRIGASEPLTRLFWKLPSTHQNLITCFLARGVMVIVVGNGQGDTSSNPGRDWLHFILH